MFLAQKLYEKGYITYVRTDSTNLSKNAVIMAREYIKNTFGTKYLPKKINIYINKNISQEAHEAIRPSEIHSNIENVKTISKDEKKLYQIIFKRFIASQMTKAQFNLIELTIKAGNFTLKNQWRSIYMNGWTKIFKEYKKNNEDCIISHLQKNNNLKFKLKKIISEKKYTKPPSRFNEASLIKELEKRGIGRPSTYPIIISTIQERGYVKIKNNQFYAEKIGEIVTNRLCETFTELMSYDFTAKMENQLDLIAKNKIKWKQVLDKFFTNFKKQFNTANQTIENGGMRPNTTVLTSIQCEICNKKMGIKTAASGMFLGCSGYHSSKKIKNCKKTIGLIPEKEFLNTFLKKNDFKEKKFYKIIKCKNCNTRMDCYFINNKRIIYICGNNPTCNGYKVEIKHNYIKNFNKINNCDKCNSPMNFKIGKFGKYIECSNTTCKNTRKILKNGKISPPKEAPIPFPELLCKNTNDYFVLKNGTSGIFFASNSFPKSKETRTPLIEELIQFKNRLPKKLNYLTQAPITDPYGNKTFVKFNQKTKQQYITSKKNDENSGWHAFFINKKWIEKK